MQALIKSLRETERLPPSGAEIEQRPALLKIAARFIAESFSKNRLAPGLRVGWCVPQKTNYFQVGPDQTIF